MRTKIASMKYLLCFIAAVMMFGSSGIVASTLPLSAFEVCLMRLIIGALSMGLIFVVTRQRLPRHVGRRQYLFVALSGACLGLAMMTIFAAYRLLGVGLGAVLAATAPVITMALSPLLFKERLRIPVMVGFAIVVGGLLLLNASALEGTLSVPGILMGLAAAASTAGMVIFNKLARDITGVPCTTIQLATAVAVALAVAAAGEGFAFIGRIPSSSWPTVIALGAVIRGSTSHYDYVCNEVSKGIAAVSLESGVPVLFGVLTTENIEQAIERAGTKAGNKGYDCAVSAIEMVNLLHELDAE